MKTFFKIFVIALVFFFANSNKAYSQSDRMKYLSYIFPADSLKGFDEVFANQDALARGFFGGEYKYFMYRAKRNYINSKYNYYQPTLADSYKGGTPNPLAAPCVNEDFEASTSSTSTSAVGSVGSTLAGWTVSTGNNTNSCTMVGCCPTAGSTSAWVRTTPWTAPTPMTLIPNSPFGGTKVLQMNDQTPGVNMVRIQQTFPVTATNALFQLAYMAALNGSGHACCDQPFIKITMLNCANVPLACPSVSITPPGSACVSGVSAGWIVNTSGISYTSSWQIQSIDLTPYLGTCVTIQITVSDCDGGAHAGWAFVDTKCSPMVVSVNNLLFPIGTTSAFASACGITTATVSAPAGLGPYTWNGPGGSGVTNNPNQTFTTSVGGQYTLTMNPLGSCSPITRTVNLSFAPNPIATFIQASSCTTYTFTNTGSGPPSVQTYSFVGAGAPASFSTTATSTVVNFPPSTTFTVFHTVVNTASCVATASMVINVPAGPNPAFTTPTYTQCLTGNSFVFTATQAATTHTFGFNPVAGAPTTGLVSPYGPVSFTAPGTYTVTHTINNAGCTTAASSVVVINPQPTVTAVNNGPLCVGGNLVLSATGGGTYQWSGPLGYSSAVQNPTIAAITAANAGVYNLTVTSTAGCKTTSTTLVAITTPSGSASNTGPYCAGATIQLNTPATATSYTWSGPGAYTSALQNPTRPAGTPAMSGVYSVTLNFGGCTATATTAVVVNALPTPTATNNTPVCAGSPINFTGSGGLTYTWTGPATYTSNTQNPIIASSAAANAGTYTLTVTDVNGCVSFTTTPVIVNPVPVPVANNTGPYCVGTTINLTSGGGGTYSWTGPAAFASALQNPTIPASVLANGGTYTVLVTLATCTAQATTNVVVSTATASAANTGPYCAGSTIQLNTPVATSYTWSGPAAFASNLQNPNLPTSTVAMSGIYTVNINIGLCIASATTAVVVNPLPLPLANSNSPICTGTDLNLTGTGGVTYSWVGPSVYTSALQNPTITAATSAAAGVYTLTVIDANTCTNTITTNVIVNPTPIIVVNNPTVCLNQTINLTAIGGATYAWAGPGGFVSAVQNPNLPVATLAMSGQYTVTVTSAAGCTNTAVSTATVYPLPNPAIVSNTPCVGTTLNLTGSGGAVYAWSGPNSFTSLSQNPNITTVSMLANGTYTLLVTAGTCTALTTAVIAINPLPTPNIVTNSPVCIGQSISLNGTGGVSYSWSGPAGFTDATQNPTIAVSVLANAGSYILTVTDANGCINSTNQAVVVNPQPIVSATGTIVCENANANLSATGGVSYSWSGPGGFTSANQNPNVVGSPASVGQYTVIVTAATGCTNTAMTTIGINPAPTPSIVTNSPICINSILAIAASGGVSYSWTGPAGFFSASQSATIQASSISVGGVYFVTATDANGCVATTSMNTMINPIPPISITGPQSACAPLCASFTAATTPSTTVDWIMGDGSYTNSNIVSSACYQTSGTFTITASAIDVNGCQNTTTFTIQVYPHPVADFNYDPYKPIVNIDADVHFTDASFGANITSWNWYFMNTAAATSNLQNPNFIYEEAGVYAIALVVKSDHGCMDTIMKSIVVGEDFGIWVPNAFTVNGDGLNDLFYAKGFGITKFEMNIYDRWGEKVFTSNDISEAWDGTYQNRANKTIKDDTYTWIINVTSVFGKAKEFTGHVTLIK